MKFFRLGDELMLRPSISRLYLGEVRSHPGKAWFRPQNIRLVLVQLASSIDSNSSRNSGTWSSISRGSGGCSLRCGGDGGGGGRRGRTSMPTTVIFFTMEYIPKLHKEKKSK